MQLCSCLATVTESKNDQIAAIPTLFLVLATLPYQCYFFLVTKPDFSQHFFKAATKPFHSFKVIPEKCMCLTYSLPLRSATVEVEKYLGPIHTVSPSPVQKPRTEETYGFPQGYKMFKNMKFPFLFQQIHVTIY